MTWAVLRPLKCPYPGVVHAAYPGGQAPGRHCSIPEILPKGRCDGWSPLSLSAVGDVPWEPAGHKAAQVQAQVAEKLRGWVGAELAPTWGLLGLGSLAAGLLHGFCLLLESCGSLIFVFVSSTAGSFLVLDAGLVRVLMAGWVQGFCVPCLCGQAVLGWCVDGTVRISNVFVLGEKRKKILKRFQVLILLQAQLWFYLCRIYSHRLGSKREAH